MKIKEKLFPILKAEKRANLRSEKKMIFRNYIGQFRRHKVGNGHAFLVVCAK